MRVLFLPFCKSAVELYKAVNEDSMNLFPEQAKREGENPTVDYSIENSKFVFTPESGIDIENVKKQFSKNWNNLGGAVNRGCIDKIPCSWIVCHKGADFKQINIDKILGFIAQINLTHED